MTFSAERPHFSFCHADNDDSGFMYDIGRVVHNRHQLALVTG